MRTTWLTLVTVAALGAVTQAAAHHSFAAEFDRNKPVTLTGTVTKVEWTNPHARIYMDVTNDQGEVEHWDFELGPVNGLMRQGWTRNSLRPGHVVTIDGFRAKDGSRVANARTVKLPDGRQVFAGSSFDIGPAAGQTAK
jgi:Family of unknown function (DUF6152)